jgi:hypothetical protein
MPKAAHPGKGGGPRRKSNAMKNLRDNQPHGQPDDDQHDQPPNRYEIITRRFAYASGAHAYAISRLAVDLEREANDLVGSDRLIVKGHLQRLQHEALGLLVWSKRAQAGVLPR